MTVEQRIERLASRMEQFKQLVEKFPPEFSNGIHGQDAAPLNPDTVRRDAIAMAQEGRNLRVGIIGRVKAGKSSLLNALLFEGQDVLPKAATPMTASLTVLGHAQEGQSYAEVEFFTQADVDDMRVLAREYDERFQQLLTEKMQAAQQRVSRPTARAVPMQDPERLRASVRRELDADPRLGGAKDMFERIQQVGGLPARALNGKPQRIEGTSVADLQGKLADYVGANGKFTPFTKCLSIYLPLPALEGVDVVDTPGVNDPIRSREERTMEELHRCDVVFVVSPSGQFLNVQDLELMGRLTYKDGVREVFLVASQIDGQLFGSERERFNGHLPGVLQGLRQTLAQQAQNTLGPIAAGNAGLETLRNELSQRLVITSSVAYALGRQEPNAWDTNTRHVWQLLQQAYPTECAQVETARSHLANMAGIGQTEALLDAVRTRKEAITEEKITSFLDDQNQALAQYLTRTPDIVRKNRDEVAKAKGGDLEAQLQSIRRVREAGTRAAEVAVAEIAEDQAQRLSGKMDAEVRKVFAELETLANQAKGTETNSYTVEKSGALSWLARKLSLGGTERRTETVNTLNATEIRNGLQNVHSNLSDRLLRIVESARQGLRTQMERSILAGLREHNVIKDRDIDSTRLAQSCQAALAQVRNFDDPVLPSLPSELMQNGVLKRREADEYDSAASTYLRQLREAAQRASRHLTADFENRLTSVSVGSRLFDHYEDRLKVIQTQIQDREQTLQRYDEFLAQLNELTHHD